MKSIYKYLLFGIVGLIICWQSIYLEKLDEVMAAREVGVFDPIAYADHAWNQLVTVAPQSSISVAQLLQSLHASPENTCEKYGNSVGVSNKCYYLFSGRGQITELEDDAITVKNLDEDYEIKIATEFIFGSTVRDASLQVPVSDFANIMDFNKVAEGMNRHVQEEILPNLLARANKGDEIQFIAVASIRSDRAFNTTITGIPIKVHINK